LRSSRGVRAAGAEVELVMQPVQRAVLALSAAKREIAKKAPHLAARQLRPWPVTEDESCGADDHQVLRRGTSRQVAAAGPMMLERRQVGDREPCSERHEEPAPAADVAHDETPAVNAVAARVAG